MKVSTLATLAVALGASPSTAALFGPSNCVSLSLSPRSTCVLTTNCEGANLANFEFAFDCEDSRDGSVVRHSFGQGGFDSNEEYDTEVACAKCLIPEAEDDDDAEDSAPEPHAAASRAPSVPSMSYARRLKQAPVATAAAAAASNPDAVHSVLNETSAATVREVKTAKVSVKEAVPDEIEEPLAATAAKGEKKGKALNGVRYGPNDCVSTYKNKEGHCVMQTDCAKEDIKNYDFGLVCVDQVGAPVRHLFGVNSFDPEETFDTLITCSSCLGLEDIPDAIALNGEVLAMGQEMKEMKDMMKVIVDNVKKLNAAVFPKQDKPAAAAASAAEEAPSSAAKEAPAAKEEPPAAKEEQKAEPVALKAESKPQAPPAVQVQKVAEAPKAIALPAAQPQVQAAQEADQADTSALAWHQRRHRHRHHRHHHGRGRHHHREEDEDEDYDDEEEDDDRDRRPRHHRRLRAHHAQREEQAPQRLPAPAVPQVYVAAPQAPAYDAAASVDARYNLDAQGGEDVDGDFSDTFDD